MFTTPDQYLAAHKAAIDTLHAVALKSVEGFERMMELQPQATKATMTESDEQVKALLAAKDAKALTDLASARHATRHDKATAYAQTCLRHRARNQRRKSQSSTKPK
jgi:phasin family protein